MIIKIKSGTDSKKEFEALTSVSLVISDASYINTYYGYGTFVIKSFKCVQVSDNLYVSNWEISYE